MADPRSNNLSEEERAFAALHQYGQTLDAIDSGDAPPDPRLYRKSAVFALRILRAHYDKHAVLEICAMSPALFILRENVTYERVLTSPPR